MKELNLKNQNPVLPYYTPTYPSYTQSCTHPDAFYDLGIVEVKHFIAHQ